MKLKLVVFCLTLLVGLTVAETAMAQVDFRVSSLPRQVRGEGRTETVGEVVLRASAAGSITAGSSITALYDGRITITPALATNVTCSFGGAAPTSAQCTAAGITVTASGNQLQLAFGATIAFATGDLINIFGVRLDVAGTGTGLTALNVTLSGSSATPGTNPITFTDAVRPIANVVRPSAGASAPVTPLTGAAVLSLIPGVLTCAPPATATPALGAANVASFGVQVTEAYPAAFTTTAQETAFSAALGTGGGAVSRGTRIQMTFTGIPAGYSIRIGTDLTADGFVTDFAGSTATLTPAVQDGGQVGEIAAAGDSKSFRFNFTATNTAAVEALVVNFVVFATDGLAVASGGLTGPIRVRVRYHEIESVINAPDQQAILSYGDHTFGTFTVANVSDCVTNLLFPFVANVVGFDTGIAIANTSGDDPALGTGLGATATSGPCTLTLFPAGGGTAVQFTTPSVPAGNTQTLVLSGTTGFSNQSGHIIGVCRFLNAHAFAFIIDGFGAAAPRVAEGYLGLILPNPRPTVVPGGEGLVH